MLFQEIQGGGKARVWSVGIDVTFAHPYIFFFRLATGPRRIWFGPKQTKKKQKKTFCLKWRLLYCTGPPFPHADASSPSLHKLCFPNRLPAASDSCQACSMLSSTDTRLASHTYMLALHLMEVFHYHGNDSTVFSPVTRFIYSGGEGGSSATESRPIRTSPK